MLLRRVVRWLTSVLQVCSYRLNHLVHSVPAKQNLVKSWRSKRVAPGATVSEYQRHMITLHYTGGKWTSEAVMRQAAEALCDYLDSLRP
jgi:hypothetical protein